VPEKATETATVVGLDASARAEAARQSWRLLAISTDLYLPAMPAMGRALGADTDMIEFFGLPRQFQPGSASSGTYQRPLWPAAAGGD
jgi:hypothetical protein